WSLPAYGGPQWSLHAYDGPQWKFTRLLFIREKGFCNRLQVRRSSPEVNEGGGEIKKENSMITTAYKVFINR
ncbi:hypothetical protein ACFLXY_06985, partial [Chloroflexota bacterium]